MKKVEKVLNDITNSGRRIVTPSVAGLAFGWATQTSRNRLCDGVFPVRTVDFMGKKMVKVEDLVAFFDNLTYSDVPTEKPKNGRSLKAVSVAKKARNAAKPGGA